MFRDVLSVFLRIQNRAFRCFPLCKKSRSRSFFWCSPSCTKSWLLMVFVVAPLVPQIVLFGASPCAKNHALDRAFLVLSFVPKFML